MTELAADAAPAAAPASEPAPVTEKPSATPREAVDRAFDKIEAEPPRPIESTTKPVEAEPEKTPAKKPAKAPAKAVDTKPAPEPTKVAEKTDKPAEGPKRAPDGKFASTEPVKAEGEEPAPRQTNFPDPPKRFSEDAKAAWNEAPEPVRAEVHRATKEMEAGLAKYKGDAEAFSELKEFADLAKSQGTTLKDAMRNYVGMENMLRKDPIAGLQQIAQNLGIPLRDIAAHIVGQKPDQVASQHERIISELKQTVQQLQQQIGGVTKTIDQQREQSASQTVAQFASSPGHERFEELATDIKFFLETKRASDLDEAYTLADRLNPGPARPATPAISPTIKPDTAAQTRKGSLSVNGAPSSGSDPATRKPPSSAQESVKRAFAQLGLA